VVRVDLGSFLQGTSRVAYGAHEAPEAAVEVVQLEQVVGRQGRVLGMRLAARHDVLTVKLLSHPLKVRVGRRKPRVAIGGGVLRDEHVSRGAHARELGRAHAPGPPAVATEREREHHGDQPGGEPRLPGSKRPRSRRKFLTRRRAATWERRRAEAGTPR